jgi:hypothetical protein
MAIVDNNIIIEGIKGKLGKMLVFRQRNGKTIVSAMPQKTNSPPSPAQKTRRTKFKQAVQYAQSVMQNPETSAWYTARLGAHQSVYHAALSDYLHAPQIVNIDVASYQGKAGDQILIELAPKSRATTVTLSLYHPEGQLAEEAPALPCTEDTTWIYTARQSISNWQALRVVVRATNRPGNPSELESWLTEVP